MEVQPKVKEIQPTQEEISEGEPSLRLGKTRYPDKEKSPWWTRAQIEPLVEEIASQIEELEEEVPQLQPRRSTRIWKPNPKYANVALIEDNGKREPNTYEVVKSKELRDAMEEEMKSLKQNENWELVPTSIGIQHISCKWVYKVKIHPNGSIERYKGWLVAQGFSQKYELDYHEAFIWWKKLL